MMAWLLQVLESLLMTGSHGVDNGEDICTRMKAKEQTKRKMGKGVRPIE
jgi:hypothetical protein